MPSPRTVASTALGLHLCSILCAAAVPVPTLESARAAFLTRPHSDPLRPSVATAGRDRVGMADRTIPPAAAAATDDGAKRAVDFFALTRALKTTRRTGWVMSGVREAESIADHMYRMSLMAMVASFSGAALDTDRCIKLALIHDLAEARVGDITPHCGVSDGDKHAMELEAMERVRELLGPALGGDEMRALWKEYEEGATEEARLLKDLDKIEMIMQAQEYEAEGNHEKSLDQFFSSTEGKWRTEIGKAWAKEIVSRRKKPDQS
ncbi:hypothetical protein ACHAWF_005267 [Thalassiosira exigua]